jgi:hypothetical protein
MELVINGRRLPVAELAPSPESRAGTHATFSKELQVRRSAWITLQAYGSQAAHPIDDWYPQATTNPIWVSVANKPVRTLESADYFVRWIDKLTSLAEAHPGWRSAKEKAHVLEQFREARNVYEHRKEEARSTRGPEGDE